jgi:hypothetical protein
MNLRNFATDQPSVFTWDKNISFWRHVREPFDQTKSESMYVHMGTIQLICIKQTKVRDATILAWANHLIHSLARGSSLRDSIWLTSYHCMERKGKSIRCDVAAQS